MRKILVLLMIIALSGCVDAGVEPVDLGRRTSGDEGVVVADPDLDGCAVSPISQEESSRHSKAALHAPGGPPLVVFLNGKGGTYSSGANDSARNISSIVGGTRTVPAFERGDQSWRQLVSCVQDQFARFNVLITEVEPTAGNYVEAVVGGYPGNIGVSNGIGGIAPIDTWGCRPMEKAIAFVFSRNLGNQQHLCEITAHEIGHTLSLEHAYLCEDPMTYLSGCGAKTFQDTEASCGTYRAERCSCRGGRQNTVRALLDLVGASNGEPRPSPEDDAAPPVAALISPEDGAALGQDTTIEVVGRASDDQFLARVELIWDFNGATYSCPTNEQNVTCAKEGEDLYKWQIRVGSGTRTYRLRAVDFAGKETITDSRSIFLGSGGQPPPPGSDDAGAPEVALISPEDGTTRPPNSSVTVTAEVTDDGAIDNVQLLWGFNGQSYPCPTNQQFVTCTVQGSRYTWQVSVGSEAPRPFSVRAFDAAGNEATSGQRTVHVRTTRDSSPPTIALNTPTVNETRPAQSQVPIVAIVSDDGSLSKVELIWDYNGQAYSCPSTSQWVGCETSNGEYRWTVKVGSPGQRRFRVRAVDAANNEARSPDRVYEIID